MAAPVLDPRAKFPFSQGALPLALEAVARWRGARIGWGVREIRRRWVAALLLAACGAERGAASAPAAVEAVPPAGREVTWLKGQLHAHTDNSGDSETTPAVALRWFARHGFDFVVFTDHNFVTVADSDGVLAIPCVELTQNLADCEPPPEPGLQCLLHVNALYIDPARAGRFMFAATDERSRLRLYGRALAATRELGGVAQLNHPNFHYAADAATITALAREGLLLVEVANEAVDSNNAGDAGHPSTEALWDASLGRGARVWAVATDDSHHYDDAAQMESRGDTAYVGDRGFVMVRAEREPAAIRAAIEREDFYASSGVVLTALAAEAGTLTLRTAEPHEFRFVGAGGTELERVRGVTASHTLQPGEAYVRAVVVAADGRRAWTQPLRP